jgi:hypothetical protein
MQFILDEKQISHGLGTPIEHPVRLFDLKGLGINQEDFLTFLRPTYESLPWDFYDVKRGEIGFLSKIYPHALNRLRRYLPDYYKGTVGKEGLSDLIRGLSDDDRAAFEKIIPYRKRSAARFQTTFNKAEIEIRRLPLGVFSQKTSEDDVRALERIFAEMSNAITDNLQFLTLIKTLASLVKDTREEARALEMTAHQVRIVARSQYAGDNAPEGIHQDGADYIVSAIVINKQGIRGGVSTVYGPDKKTPYLEMPLEPGQGIFQADSGSPFWHDVTPIELDPQSSSEEGFRDMIGFDMKIIS